ncbi:MAG: ABC transporter ATP-binding protein, partial [Lachnospiraceae bacterium]|nr:ABC transporter ATP-binding protein [Lachnospiraceae bacterium]
MAEPVLMIRDLTASYGKERILSGVSLSVNPGEVLCIAGESGSGKTSLLSAICGNPELFVESGIITFQGKELTALSGAERRRLMGAGIGLIPQNPAGSFNPLRRLEVQFRETLDSHGIPFDREEILATFSSIGLAEPEKLLRSRPYELSGGMNQRIAIAFAMLLKPALLLCDEVTSALDVTTAITVIEELQRLQREQKMTMLFVTHHLGLARRIADRIAVMVRGEIVETGTAEEVLTVPTHA